MQNANSDVSEPHAGSVYVAVYIIAAYYRLANSL